MAAIKGTDGTALFEPIDPFGHRVTISERALEHGLVAPQGRSQNPGAMDISHPLEQQVPACEQLGESRPSALAGTSAHLRVQRIDLGDDVSRPRFAWL
ncbi:MAG: hypothetical protein R3315_01645 [Woeseiaceae bacterium]|nr:hypothetical protein [Woeseiaceae bacterium]